MRGLHFNSSLLRLLKWWHWTVERYYGKLISNELKAEIRATFLRLANYTFCFYGVLFDGLAEQNHFDNVTA